MRSTVALVVFLAAVLSCGLTIGVVFTPGAWYAGLEKPPFNPPNAIFPPAWTLLYILIAIAGWRVWMRAPRSPEMKLWFTQMALNFLWTPVFFGAHLMAAGLAVILALLAVITAFIATTRRRDPVAALLFLPYWGWVAFASLLNGSLLVLNGGS
jgi:translocator protein